MVEDLNVSIAIFADVLNLVYSYQTYAEQHGIGKIIDVDKIFQTCARGRRVVKAVAYSGRNSLTGKSAFVGLNASLHLAGFELKMREIDIFESGKLKCNWDVGMTIDILKFARKVQVIILVTGDGDFIDLVKELQDEYRCEVEVVAFRDAMSFGLRSIADRYTYFDDQDFLKKALRRKIRESGQSSSHRLVESDDKSVELIQGDRIDGISGDKPNPTRSGSNITSPKIESPEILQNRVLALGRH